MGKVDSTIFEEMCTKNQIKNDEELLFSDFLKGKYNRLKAEYAELERKKKKAMVQMFIVILLTCFIMIAALIVMDENIDVWKIVSTLLFGLAFGILSALYMGTVYDIKESKVRRELLEYESKFIEEKAEDDVFKNSIRMSYKYLDEYYLQTRDHAQRGFVVTISIAIFGALLLGAGIIAMFFDVTSPAYVTCASGVIIEFISAIFFYLYNKTVSSMSDYHNKLVLSQNISIALKVAESLSSTDKAQSYDFIIHELLKDINNHLVKDDTIDT